MLKLKTFIAFILFTSFQQPSGITGNWKLIQHRNLQTGLIETEPPGIYRSIQFKFQDNGQTGTFTGNTEVNSCRGEYTLSNPDSIHVSDFGGTEIAEPEWGSKFVASIYKSSGYKITNDTLFIKYDFNTKAMVFVKM